MQKIIIITKHPAQHLTLLQSAKSGVGGFPQQEASDKNEITPKVIFSFLMVLAHKTNACYMPKLPAGFWRGYRKQKNATTLRTHFACQIVAFDFKIYALIISAESENLNGKINLIPPESAWILASRAGVFMAQRIL